MHPETLTSIHYFDFHRNLRHVYFSVSDELSIGPFPDLNITLPTPSLFKGILVMRPKHQLNHFKNYNQFRKNQAFQSKLFQSPEDHFTIDQNGVMITIRKSWHPFQSLIDNLIEISSLHQTISDSEKLKPWIKQLVPKQILSLWGFDVIFHTLLKHRSGFGDIETLMLDPKVTEILINGCESCYYEIQGKMKPLPIKMTPLRLDRLITKLIQKSGRSVNTKHPIVDLQLPSGERVNIVLPPISKKGAMISIRKFQKEHQTLYRADGDIL